MKKTERIDIRCTPQEKEKINKVLNSINENKAKKVGYGYILLNVNVNEYLENNISGLEIQINDLHKEIEKYNHQINKLIEKRSEKEIKLNKLKHELNNKSLFNISNYSNNKALNKGFNRLKEIVLNPDSNIKVFDDITATIFKQMQESFNIKDMELFKNIVKNHFQEWQQEKENNTPETTQQSYEDKINMVYRSFVRKLNSYNNTHRYEQLDTITFLNKNEQLFKTFCENANINFKEFKSKVINEHE